MVHAIWKRRKKHDQNPKCFKGRAEECSHILGMPAHFPSLVLQAPCQVCAFLNIFSINPFLYVLASVSASCKEDPELI
uniref:Uncharacterized protein n=1 Tax=Colobus angolensis palliatus TaxID=336983 RepID=A0A2K5JUX0_COLAP